MATKIVLCSDNHGYLDPVIKILNDNPAADYYIHCGDFCLEPSLAKPFLLIKGNNDWGYDLDKKKILIVDNHRILIIHGNGYTYSYDSLYKLAKAEGCDVLFFGHIHIFVDKIINGIRMINPGSCTFNRDGTGASYAIVTFDNNEIFVEKINI